MHRIDWVQAVVCATVVAGAIGGAAAQPRYRRNPQVKVDVQLTERTRPKPKQLEAAAPTAKVTGADVLAQALATRNLRLEQTELLRQLWDDTPADKPNEKAEVGLQLADTYAQLARVHRLERAKALIAADQTKDTAAKKRLQAEAAGHAREAAAAQGHALDAYKLIAEDPAFVDFPGMHQVLFAYGFTQQQAGDDEGARKSFHTLLTTYPSSRYVPDAYLAFAEYFYEQHQLGNAEAFYKKVLNFPASNVYHYARYMLGWVHVNQNQPEAAGKEFLTVIAETDGVAGEESLNRGARNDFVRVYADFGQVQKAWPLFAKLGGRDPATTATMYERLADLYAEQGKNDRAIYAYRKLMTEVPASPSVCAWQHDVAVAMLATPGATADDKVGEIERLVKLSTALSARKSFPPAAAGECRDDAQAMSDEMARVYHQEAAKTHDDATAALADRLYGAYLSGFPDGPQAGEDAYYRAELAWLRADQEPDAKRAMPKWEAAAADFTAVVKQGKTTPALRVESASAAVDAWRNRLRIDPTPKITPVAYQTGASGVKLPPPRPIDAPEQHLIDAIDAFQQVAPAKDAREVEYAFVRADTLRQFDHLDEALPAFEQIVREHPEHEAALYSANIVFDIHILAGRHAEVAKWAAYFDAHPEFVTVNPGQDRSDFDHRVAEIGMIAERLAAEDQEHEAERRKDPALYVACGQAYLKIFNDAIARDPDAGPDQKLDEVLYDAGVCFENGRSLSAAMDVYGELRERYPNAATAARALARLGGVYARVAYYDRAAASFEEYAKAYAKADDAQRALNDAVVYRKGIGDDDRAIADTRYFIKRLGRGTQVEQAADAFFGLAAIYEKRGDLDAVVAHYRRYLAQYGDRGGADRVVMAYTRIGQILWDQACPVKAIDGACVRITRERAFGGRAGARLATSPTRTRCGTETQIQLTAVPRDPAKVKAAVAAFDQAIAEYERRAGHWSADEERVVRHSYGLAIFGKSDVAYEQFLAVKFPTGLDFDPRHAAAQKAAYARLDAWFKAKDRFATTAGNGYLSLIQKIKDPAAAVAGAARVGQMSELFADALYTAEIPAFIRAVPEAVDDYCDELATRAKPYEDRALEGFGACLDHASKMGWFSSWSTLCERELGQMRPEQFPTARELRAAPDAVASHVDVERPAVSLDTP